ncbi:MAG: thioredoxin fold domain-containing protein [candidate division Zixibacteria bacterium]|nr:thioredoxin fold domain-containing protein [candidate division Zixibacteria bacterium]
MKSKLPAILSVLLLFTAATFLMAAPKPAKSDKLPKRQIDKTKITWLPYDVGYSYAKAEKKHLFIDFTAVWCGWCKKMDKETFQDTAVIRAVNENFIPVKVWGDTDSLLEFDGYKITQKDLAHTEFGVDGYPAFWFQSHEGRKVGPLPGYRDSATMLKVFDYVKEYKYDTTRTGNNAEKSEIKK